MSVADARFALQVFFDGRTRLADGGHGCRIYAKLSPRSYYSYRHGILGRDFMEARAAAQYNAMRTV